MSLEVRGDACRVCYDDTSNTVVFSGRIRTVDGELFKNIENLLENASKINKSSMIWDLRSLQDLNSAGLGILYRFVAIYRETNDYSLKVKANSNVYWQDRYLPNIKKIMPHVHLEFVAI